MVFFGYILYNDSREKQLTHSHKRNDRLKEMTGMTTKELRKLSRTELLRMLLEKTREAEQLRDELNKAKEQLQSREILLEEAGSIAEASLRLNRIFEDAQQAADQYLENVIRKCSGNSAGHQSKKEDRGRDRP